MDVLSEVLRLVRLEGALFFNGEFSAPWCLSSSPAAEIARFFPGQARHVVIFHFLTEGRAYARIPGGPREELSAGDVVVVPHGDTHLLGNGVPVRPLNSSRMFEESVGQGLTLARFGGGGEITRFVCGYMACEPRLSEIFVAGLPRIFRVRVASEPSGEWLEHSIRFSVGQASGSQAGSGLVLARLSELLFVETLRRYIATLPPSQTGWLAGVRDPVVGQALALLHHRPADPWTISTLVKRLGVSRTRFAERFRQLLGESPMAYLAQWRLKLGAELLQTTDYSIAQVAAEVGYGSEAAFNRAFKRQFSCPPAQFRRGKTALAAYFKTPVRRLAAGGER